MGGATHAVDGHAPRHFISIHAPRGGSDPIALPCQRSGRDFNPRSPWGERRKHRHTAHFQAQFQSTLPVGGATLRSSPSPATQIFQSTLPVGGATRDMLPLPLDILISIHAPRGGSDICKGLIIGLFDDFNPRSPWGERLARYNCTSVRIPNFNPRSPWGERLGLFFIFGGAKIFQSTLPVGGATL